MPESHPSPLQCSSDQTDAHLAEYRTLRNDALDLWRQISTRSKFVGITGDQPAFFYDMGWSMTSWPGKSFLKTLDELRALYENLVPVIQRLNVAAAACGKPPVDLDDGQFFTCRNNEL